MLGDMVSNLEEKQVAAHLPCFNLQIHLFRLSDRTAIKISFVGEYQLKINW